MADTSTGVHAATPGTNTGLLDQALTTAFEGRYPAELFVMDGDADRITGTGREWSDFGRAAADAGYRIGGLDTSRFIGLEGRMYADVKDEHLAQRLQITGTAYRRAGNALQDYAIELFRLQRHMEPLAADAPHTYELLQDAVEAVRTSNVLTLPSALDHLGTVRSRWNSLITTATDLQRDLNRVVAATVTDIKGATDLRFSENPLGERAFAVLGRGIGGLTNRPLDPVAANSAPLKQLTDTSGALGTAAATASTAGAAWVAAVSPIPIIGVILSLPTVLVVATAAATSLSALAGSLALAAASKAAGGVGNWPRILADGVVNEVPAARLVDTAYRAAATTGLTPTTDLVSLVVPENTPGGGTNAQQAFEATLNQTVVPDPEIASSAGRFGTGSLTTTADPGFVGAPFVMRIPTRASRRVQNTAYDDGRHNQSTTRGDRLRLVLDPGTGYEQLTVPSGPTGDRTFILINNADAPLRYQFTEPVPEGGRLEKNPDGSVTVLSAANTPVGHIARPWAKDALGREVATDYTIDGDSLIQTVHPTKGSVFPILADPDGDSTPTTTPAPASAAPADNYTADQRATDEKTAQIQGPGLEAQRADAQNRLNAHPAPAAQVPATSPAQQAADQLAKAHGDLPDDSTTHVPVTTAPAQLQQQVSPEQQAADQLAKAHAEVPDGYNGHVPVPATPKPAPPPEFQRPEPSGPRVLSEVPQVPAQSYHGVDGDGNRVTVNVPAHYGDGTPLTNPDQHRFADGTVAVQNPDLSREEVKPIGPDLQSYTYTPANGVPERGQERFHPDGSLAARFNEDTGVVTNFKPGTPAGQKPIVTDYYNIDNQSGPGGRPMHYTIDDHGFHRNEDGSTEIPVGAKDFVDHTGPDTSGYSDKTRDWTVRDTTIKLNADGTVADGSNNEDHPIDLSGRPHMKMLSNGDLVFAPDNNANYQMVKEVAPTDGTIPGQHFYVTKDGGLIVADQNGYHWADGHQDHPIRDAAIGALVGTAVGETANLIGRTGGGLIGRLLGRDTPETPAGAGNSSADATRPPSGSSAENTPATTAFGTPAELTPSMNTPGDVPRFVRPHPLDHMPEMRGFFDEQTPPPQLSDYNNVVGKPPAGVDNPAPHRSADINSPYDPRYIDNRINQLDDRFGGEGHNPGRHLYPNNETLQARLGTPKYDNQGNLQLYGPDSPYAGLVKGENKIDPLTGTTTDGVHGGPHRVGPYATRFDNAEDIVVADAYFRRKFDTTGVFETTPIDTILGPQGFERFTGFYRDPADPQAFLPIDFENGTIQPVYRQNPDGSWAMISMWSDPPPRRHP